MRIVELIVDDLDGGLDGISLVEKPAHESSWIAFAEQNYEDLEEKYLKDLLTPEEQELFALLISYFGTDEKELLEMGYEIAEVRELKKKEQFAKGEVIVSESTPSGTIRVISDPNEMSGEDSLGGDLIRYKYVGPRDSKNRDFCRVMLEQNRIFRKEDIQRMTQEVANPQFGAYDIFTYRGSYNCRHRWVQVLYRPKEGERILNDASIRRGRVGQNEIIQENTITTITANAAERTYLTQQLTRLANQNRFIIPDGGLEGLDIVELQAYASAYGIVYTRELMKKQDFNTSSVVEVLDGVPLFNNEADAKKMGDLLGCGGAHKMDWYGEELWMPCSQHDASNYGFESYDDYPQAARDNACKVLRWIDEYGRDEVSGMELTGLQRANSLCSGEKISRETIGRMAAFERHRKNAEIAEEYKGTPWKDKGYVAWLAWGGDEGIAWAQRKLDEIEREEMEIEVGGLSPYVSQTGSTIVDEDFLYTNPCQSGYIAYGTKIKNGRKVPNCVKMEEQKMSFSYDDDLREIVGAAIIPNKFIARRDAAGIYYVFFSEETTKVLADRWAKQKLQDRVNIEHLDDKFVDDVYVVESWIVEDPQLDKSTKYGFNFPKGTWVVKMKVDNDEVWQEIKQGKYTGYSIQGYFMEKLIFRSINT